MAGPQVEFVGINESVIRELMEGRHAREVMELTKCRQEYNGFAQSPIGAHKSAEGLGRPVLSVPPLAYHYWGQREGYDCWKDKNFRDEFARDNPGVRIEQQAAPKVGWREPKFKKQYSWPCER